MWTEDAPLLIICGLHRSGTTLIGELLRRSGVTVVHEPLNERFGVRDVPLAYPYVHAKGGEYAAFIHQVANLQLPWNTNPRHLHLPLWKKTCYRITGGRSGLRWRWLRLLALPGIHPALLCFKDPFLSLATPYLLQHIPCRILCLVRHPAAIHLSTQRRQWFFDSSNLYRQAELMRDYGQYMTDSEQQLATHHHAASIALLWKVMIHINLPLTTQQDRFMLCTHEEFCSHPLQVTEKIFQHFRLPLTTSVKTFVEQTTKGTHTTGKHLHDFHRNSKALPDQWQTELDNTTKAIIHDIARKEITRIYDN